VVTSEFFAPERSIGFRRASADMHEDTFWSFDGRQRLALIPCFKFVISPQTDLERILLAQEGPVRLSCCARTGVLHGVV